MFVYPIETVSNSDNGYERSYQGTCAAALFSFEVNAGETFSFSFETSVKLNKK